MEREVKNTGPLLDKNGHLVEAGYSKHLIKLYDRSAIQANKARIKEWDYYLINDQHRALALTIADNSYMGMYSVSWIDFDQKEETTKSVMTALPFGKTKLPHSSLSGDVSFKNKKIDIRFLNDSGERRLYCRFPAFKDNLTFEINVQLKDVPKDSMVIMTPFAEDPEAFYYNQKINCMSAEGTVRLGTNVYHFQANAAQAVLDWGRGVWTYANTWYWSSASGFLNGHKFGWNLGYGFGDTTAASENMLFYDGIGHKLDRVTFHIPKNSDGSDRYMNMWTITSNDGRILMNFEPILDRASNTNALIIQSDQHQVFGRFSGRAKFDHGEELHFKNIIGFAEKVKNRW